MFVQSDHIFYQSYPKKWHCLRGRGHWFCDDIDKTLVLQNVRIGERVNGIVTAVLKPLDFVKRDDRRRGSKIAWRLVTYPTLSLVSSMFVLVQFHPQETCETYFIALLRFSQRSYCERAQCINQYNDRKLSRTQQRTCTNIRYSAFKLLI
jgi:hypothetical protein